jgi:hypothetical protein
MTTLYHGRRRSNGSTEIHEGMCLTPSRRTAEAYAGTYGVVLEVEVDLASLVVERCPGYDHDTDDCVADDAAYRAAAAARGVDVLRYTDEDESGDSHVCYRLCSQAAVEGCEACVAD